jgi:glutamine synthetase
MYADRCTVPATMVVPPTTSRSACVFSTPEELVAYIAENDVEVFDIRFCDLLGVMNHLTVPASSVSVDSLAGGMAFDGSSI